MAIKQSTFDRLFGHCTDADAHRGSRRPFRFRSRPVCASSWPSAPSMLRCARSPTAHVRIASTYRILQRHNGLLLEIPDHLLLDRRRSGKHRIAAFSSNVPS